VCLDRSGDVLRVTVVDDGDGGADGRGAGGLVGLADRVAALGGRIAVKSPAGVGTTLLVEVPCASS
jgi:signal transduction histidine kinase